METEMNEVEKKARELYITQLESDDKWEAAHYVRTSPQNGPAVRAIIAALSAQPDAVGGGDVRLAEKWRRDRHATPHTDAWTLGYLRAKRECAEELEAALTARPPACETCNRHGLVGGPSYYAPDEGGEPCPDCSIAARPPVGVEPIPFGVESAAFEAHAKGERLSLEQHPLHYLFLDPKTYAARQAWKAALKFAAPAAVPVDGENVTRPVMSSDDFDNMVESEAGEYGEMLEDGGAYSGWSFSCEALVEFSRAIINAWGLERRAHSARVATALADSPTPAALATHPQPAAAKEHFQDRLAAIEGRPRAEPEPPDDACACCYSTDCNGECMENL
ncbi:hypothetical protein RT95_20780 [Xanthomonas campestris]|nr:hypothetical protein RT95_20780 [Xanthomonas campestris]